MADSLLSRVLMAIAEGAPKDEQFSRLGKMDSIRAAMEMGRKLEFSYTRKRDGAELGYVVNAYSRRGNKLYATDHKHGADQIHAFLLHRIRDASVLPDRRYNPVWDVEPESV